MEKKRGKERPGNSTHPREEGKGCRGRRCVPPSLPTWVSLWPKGAVEPKGNARAPFFSLPGDETAYAMLDATGLSVPVLVSLGTIGKWRVAVLGPWVRFAVSATRRVADDPEQPESSSHPEPEPWPSVSRGIRVSMHPRVHVHRNAPDRRQAAWAALSDAVGHTPAARARRSSRLRKPGDPWPLCAPLTGLTPRRGFFV